MTVHLLAGEQLDDLQNGYKIIQDPKDFCFGMDAVLLSRFAGVRTGERVVDFCCGTGIVPILMRARHTGVHYTGLELQEKSAQLAKRSVEYNHLEDDIEIVTGDVKEAAAIFGAASFDVVTCNPPYMTNQHGLTNQHRAKAIARHEICCTLEDVIAQAAKVLNDRGRFYMVHRPFRLAEIMTTMTKYKLEPKRMQLVYPYADKEPNMVLIEGLYGGRPRITVEKPLIVYQKPGVYTDEILKLYDKEEHKEV